MSVLRIITGAQSPILRAVTAKIPKVTKDIDQLIDDLLQTCVAADGLGLAAPQVDRSERVCVARINRKLTPLVNPDIAWKSEETWSAEEGCLSLPGQYVDVMRPASVIVKYKDRKGVAQERKLEGMDARVVQHEVDHLNGVLIVDYATLSAKPRL